MANSKPVHNAAVAVGQVDQSTGLPIPGALLSTTGSFGFTDVDLNDTHWTWVKFDAKASGTAKALVTLKPVIVKDAKGGVKGQVGWTYTVAASAIEYPAAGQTLTQVFNVMVGRSPRP